MEQDHSERVAEIKFVYDTIRGLLDRHLAKLPPDVVSMVSDVGFGFYNREAIVHVLRVNNPHSQGAFDITLMNMTNDTHARYTLMAEGGLALTLGSTTAESNPAYASASDPFGAELGADFINNFSSYYAGQLDQAKVTATIHL